MSGSEDNTTAADIHVSSYFFQHHCISWESIPGQQLTALIYITSENLNILKKT